jgi:hypothetical protein
MWCLIRWTPEVMLEESTYLVEESGESKGPNLDVNNDDGNDDNNNSQL